MKKNFTFLFLLVVFFLRGEPHLILNFDVNKTLIASDKTENKSLEDVINELLSRKYSACWDETVFEPITFDAYVRNVMMPGEEHDVELKMARLVHLTHFIDYLQEHDHPLLPIVSKQFNMIIDTLKGAHIFPSFYRLIDYLDEKSISYTLFLRSFGKEVFEVKNVINAQLNDLFEVEGEFRKGILNLHGEGSLAIPQDIQAFFYSRRHAAIHDDWPYWMKGEMFAQFGKPFYISLEDREHLSLFFDDNIKVGSFDKNVLAPLNGVTGESIPIPVVLNSKQMIFVDTLEAITNENYFIERVEEALKEYYKYWEN